VLIDRNQDRLVAAATLPLLQLGALPILNAGVAAISTRAQITAVLQAASLPRPETVVACGAEAALAAFDQLGGAATLLPLTPGEPAVPLWDRDSAEAVFEHRCVLGSAETRIALLQAGTPTAAERATIIVVGGQAVGVETAGDAAAFAEPAALSLAGLAAQTLGADIVGVEIAQTEHGWVVWDINPAPEFRSVQPLGASTVADAIAALAVSALQPEPSLAELVSMDHPAAHVAQNGGQVHVYAAAF
jgi:glutathione synthase/RimK-type ligase-like ATP-grasp enzyme